MLRGPKLHPTIATCWVDDVGLTGRTRKDYLGITRRLQDRAIRWQIAAGDNPAPAGTTWRARPLTPADQRGKVRFNEIGDAMIRDYVDYRDDGQRRADRSRATTLGVVWQLYDWATSGDAGKLCDTAPGPLVPHNPVARLRALARRSRRSPRDVYHKTWLSQDWVRVLIATTRGDGTRAVDRRDAVLLSLYLYTGLRLFELIEVRWGDLDWTAGEYGGINVIRKGGKPGVALLNEAARRELFAWRSSFVEAVGEDIDGLRVIPQVHFVTVGHPLARPRVWRIDTIWTRGITSGNTVRNIVRARAEAAGITHLAPHDLRRSYAGMMEDLGADLRDIQAGLGHAHLATTERYLKQRTKLAPAAKRLDFG